MEEGGSEIARGRRGGGRGMKKYLSEDETETEEETGEINYRVTTNLSFS